MWQKSHRLARIPPEDLAPLLLMNRDMAVEVDRVAHIQALNLPGVAEVQPVVWLLMLEAVHDGLRTAPHRSLKCTSVHCMSYRCVLLGVGWYEEAIHHPEPSSCFAHRWEQIGWLLKAQKDGGACLAEHAILVADAIAPGWQ